LVEGGTFEDLPRTTFLDIEAVAVELSPRERGRPRGIAEHGFLEAMRTRTIDINLEPNPFPELCVVRTLALARNLRLSLSSRLVQSLARQLRPPGTAELLAVQLAPYGSPRVTAARLDVWRRELGKHADAGLPLRAPHRLGPKQRVLFSG